MWGGADYERLARLLAPVQDELAARLAPAPGDRFLDVGTGTGELALRAARAGAEVTGVDISEPLLALARGKAEGAGLAIAFEAGDAQALPFGDASFDVAGSSFAIIFAPDAARAAGELARVVRPGGRIGLATWCPNEAMARIYDRFQRRKPSADMEAWGTPGQVRHLLGADFELDVARGTWRYEADSAEELWELAENATPPTKAFLATLDDAGRESYRDAMLEHWGRFRTADGRISEPREYLLALGTRR